MQGGSSQTLCDKGCTTHKKTQLFWLVGKRLSWLFCFASRKNEEASAETPTQKPLDFILFSILSCKDLEISGLFLAQRSCPWQASHFPAARQELSTRAVPGELIQSSGGSGADRRRGKPAAAVSLSAKWTKRHSGGSVAFYHLANSDKKMVRAPLCPQALIFVQVCIWSALHTACCTAECSW